MALPENVALIYGLCDNQNRHLRNQVFFRKIFIDEDRTVRVAYQAPCDALCDARAQGNALNWAAEATKKARFKPKRFEPRLPGVSNGV
ncbi:hypothetical protein [Glutamicibacter sp. NPDC087344]|uniref:hypothetical protein n=1 Tax=Glutamicibacter sp. NPDC087344 TaxID=3363994 RepID=UPI003829F109